MLPGSNGISRSLKLFEKSPPDEAEAGDIASLCTRAPVASQSVFNDQYGIRCRNSLLQKNINTIA